MTIEPFPLNKPVMPGRYRLYNGDIGTYREACLECIAYWAAKVGEVQAKLDYFKEELEKEIARESNTPEK